MILYFFTSQPRPVKLICPAASGFASGRSKAVGLVLVHHENTPV